MSSIVEIDEHKDSLSELLANLPKLIVGLESRLTDIERQVSEMNGEFKADVVELKDKMQSLEKLSMQTVLDTNATDCAVSLDQPLEQPKEPKPNQSHMSPGDSTPRINTRSYALEQNVYGYLLMPSRKSRMDACLLLLLHYVLVAGITIMIHLTTLETSERVSLAVDELCQDVNGAWDCNEPVLKSMMEFAVMDGDGDGRWSMPEARARGTLSQFQALHEVASQSNDILQLVAPAKDAVPNLFCHSVRPMLDSIVAGGFLTFDETLQIARDEMGLTLDDMNKTARALNYCGHPPEKGEYFRVVACVMRDECATSPKFRSSPASSSTEQYSNLTGQYSFFPMSVLKVIMANLLRPCLLVDRDQCANAEIKSNFLREVPIWQDLDSAERVKRCVSHVEEVCPNILGDQYQTFAQQMQDICGPREHAQEHIPAPIRKIHKRVPKCKDDDSSFQKFMTWLVQQQPSLDLVLQKIGGIAHVSCSLAGTLGLCQAPFSMDLPFPLTDPTSNRTQRLFFWEAMPQFCPDTCCKKQSSPVIEDKYNQTPHVPLACDAMCFQAEKHGSPNLEKSTKDLAFPLECFGEKCNLLQVTEPGFGNVRISFRNDYFSMNHTMRIGVYSHRSVRVHVLGIFSGGDPDCLNNSLQIDGTRICKENLHKNLQMLVPLRQADSFQILFQPSGSAVGPGCIESSEPGSCDWDIIVSDAGEPDKYTMSLTSFEQETRFDEEVGVRSVRFGMFFSLILIVWLVFMSPEIAAVYQLVIFILHCPKVDLGLNWIFGPRGQRATLLMCIALPRLLIWCWVFFVGVKLLTLSTDPIEIVLNSVALAFIMDIDETLYEMTAADDVKTALRSLDEFVWPRHHLDLTLSPKVEVLVHVLLMMIVVSGFIVYEYLDQGGWLQTASMVDCICLLQGPHCASGVLN